MGVSSSLKINLLSFYFLINLLSNRKFPLCTLWCKYLFSWKPIAHSLGPGMVWAADETYLIKVKKTQHKTSYQNMRLKTCIFPACCSTLIAQWIRKVNYLGDLCRPLYPIGIALTGRAAANKGELGIRSCGCKAASSPLEVTLETLGAE